MTADRSSINKASELTAASLRTVMKPDECIYGVIKIIQVSWLEEEVARCDIDAGRCEVFIP